MHHQNYDCFLVNYQANKLLLLSTAIRKSGLRSLFFAMIHDLFFLGIQIIIIIYTYK